MQQPPTERQEFAIGLEVVAVGLLDVIVVVVFQAYGGILGRVGG